MFPWFRTAAAAASSAPAPAGSSTLTPPAQPDGPNGGKPAGSVLRGPATHAAAASAPDASPKHSPAKKKKWGYSADDIAEWRAARRKNYPTDGNLARKAAEAAQKAAAGGVARSSTYRVQNHRLKPIHTKEVSTGTTGPIATSPAAAAAADAPHGTAAGALGMLAAYGDGSGSSSEEETAPPTTVSNDAAATLAARPRDIQGLDNTSTTKRPARPEEPDLLRKRARSERQRWRANRPTLLERLLADKVQQQDNAVLQCIRYCVQHDYLGQAR